MGSKRDGGEFGVGDLDPDRVVALIEVRLDTETGRSEVEELVKTAHGDQHLRQLLARAELVAVYRELKRLRAQLSALEERRAALIAGLAPSN